MFLVKARYAVKHAGDKLENLQPVPLHQAGPSRTKKEMKPVQPTHILCEQR